MTLGKLVVQSSSQDWQVTVHNDKGLFSGTVNGKAWWALDRGDTVELQVGGWRRVLHRAAPADRAAGTGNQALAPMHGVIVAINVKAGDEVAESDTLVVLEAMKMENHVRAPRAGKVALVRCEIGIAVSVGQVLVELAPIESKPVAGSS